MDSLSPVKRSWLMGQVASKNTKPELAIRRLLHSMGYRFRLHAGDLPGKPDIIFTARKKAIFVHGCFWHGHLGCRYAKLPKTRIEFWSEKMDRNRVRDERAVMQLQTLGWECMVVWQCELKDTKSTVAALAEFLGPTRHGSVD
jgi:DNA mismatch endonuclease (patch repair protein)